MKVADPQAVLRDLAQATATFQLRTIAAHLRGPLCPPVDPLFHAAVTTAEGQHDHA